MESSTGNVKMEFVDKSQNTVIGSTTGGVVSRSKSSTTCIVNHDTNTINPPADETMITGHDSIGNFHIANDKEACDHQHIEKSVEESSDKSAIMKMNTDLTVESLTPQYDLAALWDKHCEYEFGTRDVPATMSTMVSDPYVNHIPTMTGGVGANELSRFYQHHFVNNNPADTSMITISRTVGTDRVVDEMLFSFTHDREIDWMLPGIPPTGKFVKIPLVAIVTFRDGKLYNEHIYWDQASVLVQIGLLDPNNLPVAGVETADKLLNKNLPSNTLMKRWTESANKN